MDQVGVAADGAVFAVGLVVALRAIERDDDRLAAGRADVRPFVRRSLLAALLLHDDSNGIVLQCRVRLGKRSKILQLTVNSRVSPADVWDMSNSTLQPAEK